MESYLRITQINDFIFCPRSIYYHNLFENNYDSKIYKETAQITGNSVHESISTNKYSSSKNILQNTTVFCEKYNLVGKIDIFDIVNSTLIERKNSITAIYDGFRYQLYAQMFALSEMGYEVKKLKLYSYKDNKNYDIELPDIKQVTVFEKLLSQINEYDILSDKSKPNINKCQNCNYRNLCDLFEGGEI